MAQLVTRVGQDLVEQLDALVESGAVESRSDGVRTGLRKLIASHRRQQEGQEIIAAYEFQPQASLPEWSDADSVRMIAKESW